MAEKTEPVSASAPLPDSPNLEWLRKEAKRRLADLRVADPSTRLAVAQLALARHHGFKSWRALKAHVDSLTVDGRLCEAARRGEVEALEALLDEFPGKLQLRTHPYGGTLLHLAAAHGQAAAVELLLRRGLDANLRDTGDNAYAMHFAAGAGHLEVVRLLADAGGDVVGRGDDHALEVIGWATCFDDCHAEVADFLVSRGARHHIFSAIALGLQDELRRIVAEDPGALASRQSHNEDHRHPLHFAVRKRLPEMVALLLELGADPLALDGSGHSAAAYATTPEIDRKVMERILGGRWPATLGGEAREGRVRRRDGTPRFVAALALNEWEEAVRLLAQDPARLVAGGADAAALHLMAKRGATWAVRWLLDRGADPSGRWWHWDTELTPLHLAAAFGHEEAVRFLLTAGADTEVRDTQHEGTPLDWARHFGQPETARLLEPRPTP
jgi:ankyrin repeat protein